MKASVATKGKFISPREVPKALFLEEGEVVRLFAREYPLRFTSFRSSPYYLRGQSRDLDNCYIISKTFITFTQTNDTTYETQPEDQD